MVKLTVVLPVHNEEQMLAANVARMARRLRAMQGAIYLVENGSRDRSWELARGLEGSCESVPVQAFRELSAGIGYAYQRGIEEALRAERNDSARKGHWVLLSAADLPFGFTDLDGAEALLTAGDGCRTLIGSKAHPQSQVSVSLERRLASMAYRQARRLVLGMRTADSQGTVFLRLDLAAALVGQVRSRDFFYSTELIYLVERSGERVLELPVTLEPRGTHSMACRWVLLSPCCVSLS